MCPVSHEILVYRVSNQLKAKVPEIRVCIAKILSHFFNHLLLVFVLVNVSSKKINYQIIINNQCKLEGCWRHLFRIKNLQKLLTEIRQIIFVFGAIMPRYIITGGAGHASWGGPAGVQRRGGADGRGVRYLLPDSRPGVPPDIRGSRGQSTLPLRMPLPLGILKKKKKLFNSRNQNIFL